MGTQASEAAPTGRAQLLARGGRGERAQLLVACHTWI
jgi:hypothetical protein